MKTVKRFDSHKIGKNVQVTDQGFLMIPAFTARTGIQNYKDSKGKLLRELRPDDEVFDSESMASMRTAVVTDGHPPVMVTPDNVDEYGAGFTNGVVTKETVDGSDESFLGTHVIVTHRDAIEAIQAGKAELSNGYRADLEFVSGEHNGKKFDAIQRNIRINHIAIVWEGRAGKHARLKLDSNDAILIDENQKGETMKVVIHGKEFEVADELGKELEAERSESKTKNDADLATEKTRADDAIAKNSVIETEKTALETEKTGLEAKNDSLTEDLKKSKNEKTDGVSASAVNEAVKKRLTVINVGKKLLDAETVAKLDEMSDEEIKKAVIKADSPAVTDEKLEKEVYVDARFDHISETLDESAAEVKTVGDKIVKTREGGKGDDGYKTPEQRRQDSMAATVENSSKQIGRRADK